MATSSMSTASTSSPKAKASGSAEAGGFAVTKRYVGVGVGVIRVVQTAHALRGLTAQLRLRKELMTLMVSLSKPGRLVVDGSSDSDDSYARRICVSGVGLEFVQVGRDVDGSGRDGELRCA
jgi:hypothetical protein